MRTLVELMSLKETKTERELPGATRFSCFVNKESHVQL